MHDFSRIKFFSRDLFLSEWSNAFHCTYTADFWTLALFAFIPAIVKLGLPPFRRFGLVCKN
jgi:hypothetical protein